MKITCAIKVVSFTAVPCEFLLEAKLDGFI